MKTLSRRNLLRLLPVAAALAGAGKPHARGEIGDTHAIHETSIASTAYSDLNVHETGRMTIAAVKPEPSRRPVPRF
jgi:hypothetical protein